MTHTHIYIYSVCMHTYMFNVLWVQLVGKQKQPAGVEGVVQVSEVFFGNNMVQCLSLLWTCRWSNMMTPDLLPLQWSEFVWKHVSHPIRCLIISPFSVLTWPSIDGEQIQHLKKLPKSYVKICILSPVWLVFICRFDAPPTGPGRKQSFAHLHRAVLSCGAVRDRVTINIGRPWVVGYYSLVF